MPLITHAFLIALPPLTLPLALVVVCEIQNHTPENPVVSDSCVLGQDLGIPGFLGYNTFGSVQSQALRLGQSRDRFWYFPLCFTKFRAETSCSSFLE